MNKGIIVLDVPEQGVINATIKEHEDNNKSKDNLRKE